MLMGCAKDILNSGALSAGLNDCAKQISVRNDRTIVKIIFLSFYFPITYELSRPDNSASAGAIC